MRLYRVSLAQPDCYAHSDAFGDAFAQPDIHGFDHTFAKRDIISAGQPVAPNELLLLVAYEQQLLAGSSHGSLRPWLWM